MFDKMIVSNGEGAGSAGRGRYFLVTTGIVGILFVTAIVMSIYAVDVSLGTDELSLSVMVAPVTPDEPEPPRPDPPRDQPRAARSELPTRVVNMLRPDEQPIKTPDSVATTPNPFQSRPDGRFRIDSADTAGIGIPGELGTPRGGNASSGSGSLVEPEPIADTVKIPEPPPVMKPKPPTGPISLGVVNGKALDLPKPPYPAAAIAMNAQGEVTVQVTIDETGRVVSAKAAKGHPIFRAAAERAALGARFSPTFLSKVPVKVTGVIVYNFKRS